MIKKKKSVIETIYLAMIHFDEVVHAPVLGFTKFISLYVSGETEEKARDKIRNYLDMKYSLSPVKINLSIALKQNPEKYIQLIK